eukprot:4930818-Amphidinium_carterae.1
MSRTEGQKVLKWAGWEGEKILAQGQLKVRLPSLRNRANRAIHAENPKWSPPCPTPPHALPHRSDHGLCTLGYQDLYTPSIEDTLLTQQNMVLSTPLPYVSSSLD